MHYHEENGLKIYLVGGAVRDKYLNLPVDDRDWVVEGAVPEELIHQGFQQVGKDFPVFLHPQSKEEYALARTERKLGRGYYGFTTHFTPDITLQQDLSRRDLTINAMAENSEGGLIDPYGGLNDLHHKILRHVSEAFPEDPLRVLRVARFAARFADLGFTVASDTLTLMTHMSTSGELKHLTPERVWRETEKALVTTQPQVYFQVLRDCGALAVLFPEIDKLFGVPTSATWHPEMDAGHHTLIVLRIIAELSPEIAVRFAALTHKLGKGTTDPQGCPHYLDHELSGVTLINHLCQRLPIPHSIRNLARLAAKYHHVIHKIAQCTPLELLTLLNRLDVWRQPQRLEQIILISKADLWGHFHLGTNRVPYPAQEYLQQAYHRTVHVSVHDIIADGFQGNAIRQELQARRLKALEIYCQATRSPLEATMASEEGSTLPRRPL